MNRLVNINAIMHGWGTTYGRRSSRGIYTGGFTANYTVDLPSQPTTVIFGFAIYLNGATAPAPRTDQPMLLFYDAFPTGNIHVQIQLNADRTLSARQGWSPFTIIGTTTGHSIEPTTWYYVEVKVTISDTVGQVTINVNGVERLSTSADKDTLNGSNAYVEACRGFYAYNIPTWIDDVYICDTSGSKNNDFLGDIRIDPLRPDGAGAHTEFTPSAGSNYQNVDETTPDGDTTYNDGDTTNDEDSYAISNIPSPTGTTIHGVKSQITVRKTDAGTRKCKVITRSGGTDYLGDEETLSDSFQTFTKVYENNPDDSATWEDADVSGMEVGIKVTA